MSEFHYGKPQWMRQIFEEHGKAIGWEEVSLPRGDLISRENAETYIKNYFKGWIETYGTKLLDPVDTFADICGIFDMMPSVESKGDLINRTALRDALYDADAVTMKGVEIINNFPAVEPRKGEWITLEFEDSRLYRCSECKRSGSIPTYYCPHCGAEM